MANAFPTPVVASPARTPAPYGLFSVLDFREPLDRYWEGGGVTWLSFDGATQLGIVGRVQEPYEETSGLPKTFTPSTETDAAGVFTVYGTQKVTPGEGWDQAKAQERANTILTTLEERTVEAVLSGAVPGLTPNFSSATTVNSTSSFVDAVAYLENWLANQYGSRGVLHLSRGNAIRAIAAKALETRGGGLFTRLGTPVVAGSGYDDDSVWATSSLVAYRSEVFPRGGIPYDLLDKNTNDLYAIAERTYSIGFESRALGVVTITTP